MYILAAVTVCYLGYELKRFKHATTPGAGKFEIVQILSACNQKVIAVVHFNKLEETQKALKKLKKDYYTYIVFNKIKVPENYESL